MITDRTTLNDILMATEQDRLQGLPTIDVEELDFDEVITLEGLTQ